MLRLVRVLLRSSIAALKTQRKLALENLALRHQLAVLQAASQRRLSLTDLDRAFWIVLRRYWTDWKRALVIVQPETVVRWHREGFRRYWRRKSRRPWGRPGIDPEIRSLIRKWSTQAVVEAVSTSSRRPTNGAQGRNRTTDTLIFSQCV